jgi:hypothetical protein
MKGGINMNDYVKAIDGLPFLFKLILAFPVLDGIVYGIYRIAKGFQTNNMLMVIIGIIWVFAGTAIFWIIDIISVLIYGKVVLFA